MCDFFKQMADKADDGIMFADEKGIIKYWNGGCENIFGFSEEEAVGENLDIIIPEKHRKRHWDGYFEVLKTGETAYKGKMLQVPALKKNGERILIRFSIQLIEEDGKYIGFSSVVREVQK
jgi:PAS domain S-box-containing protein